MSENIPLFVVKVGVPGAREAATRGDVVVVIDALRASVTITSALVVGAVKVIPMLTVAEARAYLDQEGYLVAGERGGVQIEGFHFGNSPTELWRQATQVKGKTLVLTTSSGTRCVEAAQEGGAVAVLTGALPNATALAQAAFDLSRERGRDISLVAAGVDDQATVEDLFAARLISQRLAVMGAVPADREWGDHRAESEAAEVLRSSPSGQKLKGLGYEEDVAFCAQIDVFDVVPIYRDGGFVVFPQRTRESAEGNSIALSEASSQQVGKMSTAEAASTPPGCRAWEPGLLDPKILRDTIRGLGG